MQLAFSIASPNYLPQIMVLAESFKASNPDDLFVIAVLSDSLSQDYINLLGDFPYVTTSILPQDKLAQMSRAYQIHELSYATKSYFALALLEKYADCDGILYLDGDMWVKNHINLFENDTEFNRNKSIFLTPHILQRASALEEIEKDLYLGLLKYGVFNAGFFAVKNNDKGKAFLNWWADYMLTECVSNLEKGQHHDQNWFNLVPAIFTNDLEIITHPGYNVAAYNLHERKITSNQGIYFVNEKYPLVIFHFTGYKLQSKERLSTMHAFSSFDKYPELKDFYDTYYKAWLEKCKLFKIEQTVDKKQISFKKKVQLSLKIRTIQWLKSLLKKLDD